MKNGEMSYKNREENCNDLKTFGRNFALTYAFAHANLIVTDLSRSLKFYEEALKLKEVRRKEYPDAYMVYLINGNFTLELRQFKEPMNFEVDARLNHIAFYSDSFDDDLKRHQEMGCVDRILEEFGIYFIHDCDGHCIEIMRKARN